MQLILTNRAIDDINKAKKWYTNRTRLLKISRNTLY